MNDSVHTVGFVYVLTNESMPGLVKIGLTSHLPEDRAQGLYTTGLPTAFSVAFRTTTSWPRAVENMAHELLDSYRTSARREFFRVSVTNAIDAIRRAMIEAAGIIRWKRPQPHLLSNGDRLSLVMKAGQVIALVGYKSLNQLMVGKPEILDLWQAHSHGDLLEIFATHSPSNVSGFSDGDPGSDEDPVPYLNREKTVINGLINGRERLMPGERLVWLPAPEDTRSEVAAVFEALDHCQVVSRTWSPVIGAHGLPFLLNDFLHDTLWPEASHAIQSALALSVPRAWAPRGDRDLTWAPIGTEPPQPEHWLSQLTPRPRNRTKGER